MDFIRFSVRGQRLDYDKRYYSSTETIDTLYCNFKFETDDLGHVCGGWNLPHLWAQFHDEEGNVYVKKVTADNTCSIPYSCLRQHKFKMTLFATDTENYMECTKRFTTNEVLFIFNGLANLNYDGGVSPDEPLPTNWQILLDRVDECEGKVEGLSQDVATMGDRVDTLSQNVTSMQSTVDELSTGLAAESTARENADADLRLLINDEINERASGDNALQQSIDSLDARESEHYSDCTEKMDNLDSRITSNANDIATLNALTESIKGTGAGFHSSIYRGKYLGDTYTDEQKQAIASGSFDDLFVGDYWTINGVNWRIADFDYYYNIGDTNFTKHHVIIVPDRILYSAQMNSENITTGAYTGSEMYTTNLDNARAAFDNAFGESFIPTHRGLYANAVSGSNPSGWAWRDMRVELMSEEQVYGHSAWGVASHNGFDIGTQKTQFKLFVLDQTKINIRQYYWLTNVRSSTSFAIVISVGGAYYDSASYSYGVRPFACLVGA